MDDLLSLYWTDALKSKVHKTFICCPALHLDVLRTTKLGHNFTETVPFRAKYHLNKDRSNMLQHKELKGIFQAIYKKFIKRMKASVFCLNKNSPLNS